MPTRRRLIFLIVLSLALGSMTTVLVAWACIYADHPHALHGGSADKPPLWKVSCWYGPAAVEYRSVPVIAPSGSRIDRDFTVDAIPNWCMASDPVPIEIAKSNIGFHWWSDHARGWPMLAMRSRVEFEAAPSKPRSQWVVHQQWGYEARWMSGYNFPMFIPLRPMWPGFVVDTVLYATIWSGLLAAPGFIKRKWRRSRTACTECGYLLRGLGVDVKNCPECGAGASRCRRRIGCKNESAMAVVRLRSSRSQTVAGSEATSEANCVPVARGA